MDLRKKFKEETGEDAIGYSEGIPMRINQKYVVWLEERLQNNEIDNVVMPELTPFEVSIYQRERDVISYIAGTIELLGGDQGPGLDSLKNWLYRLRKKVLRL